MQRRVPVGLGLLLQDPLASEIPQQVMDPVMHLPGNILAGDIDQVRLREALQQVLGRSHSFVQERGNPPRRKARHANQPKPPECHALAGGSSAVAQRHHRPHPHVTHLELAEPSLLVLEALQQLADPPVRTRRQLRPGDLDRQRQVAAQPHDRSGRAKLSVDSFLSDDACQQAQRGLLVQHVKRNPIDAIQPKKLPAACYQHRAARPPRDERPHLQLVSGVVEQHQKAALSELGPVDPRPILEAARHRRWSDAEVAEEFLEDLAGVDRSFLDAVQVDVELPGGKVRPDHVCDTNSQRGLADTAFAADHQDRWAAVRTSFSRGCGGDGADRALLVGEVHRVRGELEQLGLGQQLRRSGVPVFLLARQQTRTVRRVVAPILERGDPTGDDRCQPGQRGACPARQGREASNHRGAADDRREQAQPDHASTPAALPAARLRRRLVAYWRAPSDLQPTARPGVDAIFKESGRIGRG